MRIDLAIASLLLAAACVEQERFAPSANAIVVHAVLDVTARDQYVVVQTTNGLLTEQRAVAGAAVSIATPDGHLLVADEVRDSSFFGTTVGVPLATPVYRISLDRYGTALIAGGAYTLRIVLPDERVVTGRTTIPRTIPSFATRVDTIGRGDSLRLDWARVPGVRAYELSISPSSVQRSVFVDTSVTLTSATRFGSTYVFRSNTTYALLVNAVDDNYYDYLRRDGDPFTSSGVITRLDGAVGVFGSVVPVARRTVVVR